MASQWLFHHDYALESAGEQQSISDAYTQP